MAEIYVSPTGSDTSGDGSQSNPYQHIYYAIDQANDGDTIICLSGTYYENQGRSIDKNLTIKSQDENWEDVTIVIDGLCSGYWDCWLCFNPSEAKTLTIKGITFKWGSASSSDSVSYIELNNYADSNAYIEVVGCFFDGSGIDSGNNSNGLCSLNGNMKVYKSTFRHFRSSSYQFRAVFMAIDTVSAVVKDCIFEDNNYAIRDYRGTFTSDYNCFYNNDYNTENADIGTNSITSDPQFTGTDTAELQDSSPCKDAGIVITGYVEEYEGDAPDIGCYEIPAVIYKISGQVTLNGNPVQGAKVRAICQDDNSYGGDAVTDENGNYEITGLEENKKYHIIVEYTDSDTGQKYNAESKWDITPVEKSS